jgi:DNA polymerase bacteriophage-type
MSSAPTLSIDFETASTVDLRRAGAHVYSKDPSTRVLCMAWAFDMEDVQVWTPGQKFPQRVLDHVQASNPVRGWNVKFEYEIWNNTLCRMMGAAFANSHVLDVYQLRDTMAQAAYWGLPLSLDMAASALPIKFQKDKQGHSLMLQMCKPRSRDPATGAPIWWHETDSVKFQQLKEYCARDVETERAVCDWLPELPNREQVVWRADALINQRGVQVDTVLVDRMLALANDAVSSLNVEIQTATYGAVKTCNQSAAILAYLRTTHGLEIPDLRRDTVKEWLGKVDPEGSAYRILEIRREAARTSTSKLKVLLSAVAKDNRIRGMLQHYGAARTGRWAGRLFQPQNLPRGTVKNVDALVDAILAGATVDDLEMLANDSAMGVLASAIRSCLVAPPGKVLVSADLSQIEARVVAWLAGQTDILAVFASGEDVYTFTAHRIGSKDRQLGKVCVLGLGFGMGPDKFVATAKTYGITLTVQQAEEIVRAWRTANAKIAQFWWDCDRAFRDVVLGRGGSARATVGRIAFVCARGTVLVTLPSGRSLVYRDASIEHDPETGRDAITFMGLNQYTRRWERCRTYGGKLVENIVQATARDIMAEALVDMDQRGFAPILSVHDEAIAEADETGGATVLKALLDIMQRPRSWTWGLPIAAAGWFGKRYKKG